MSDLSVQTIFVCCGCSDGKTRGVILQEKEAKQIIGYIQHVQGGKIRIGGNPLVILDLETAAKMARDDAAHNRATFWQRIFKRAGGTNGAGSDLVMAR